MVQILQIDRAGLPVKWLNFEKAALHAAKGNIAWSLGDTCATLRGGTNAKSGERSILELKPIISVIGESAITGHYRQPPVSSRLVHRRDRHLCAYCGDQFREDDLTLDHIHPCSRGGKDTWMNLVAACRCCNNRKDNRTPEEARMPLLFVPYVPNMFEAFILANRTILADQMEFLKNSVPKTSRLWQ